MENIREVEISRQQAEEIIRAKNEEFLAQYPTDDAQIDYYTELAMKLFDEFQIDGTYRYDGVRKNVKAWYENKKNQMELFRNHPYWDEEAKAIIFQQTEVREIDYNSASTALYKLHDYVTDHYDPDDEQYIVGVLQSAFDVLANEGAEMSSTLTERFIEVFNNKARYYGRKIPTNIQRMLRVGTKITKLVRKIYAELLLDNESVVDATTLVNEHAPDDRTYKSFDKYYARLADCLSELTVKKITLVSLNFLDFMTMSNGNSWSSCHFINSHGIFHEDSESSYHGLYKQGCLSYALDEPSFLLYTLPATFEGNDYYRCQKLTRMCCQYKCGILVTGKCYPNNEDGLITRYRQTLQKIISELENCPNLWTFSKRTKRIEAFTETASNSAHYPDYRHDAQKPTISLCKGFEIDIDEQMVIGHEAYCLHCGDTLDGDEHSHLQCCDHNHKKVCERCGSVIEDDDECYEIDDDYYCDDCVFYCGYHEEYESISDEYGTIETPDGEIQVCDSAYRYYVECCDCGCYVLECDAEMHGGEWYCESCAEEYTWCKCCGRLVEDDGETFCRGCRKMAKDGIAVKTQKRYSTGDYVLMTADISQCGFGINDYMERYYPNRIVRICEVASLLSGVGYRTQKLHDFEYDNWVWTPNCFVGKVIGATDDMVGKTLYEVSAMLAEEEN